MMLHKLYLTLRCQAHRFRDAPGKAPRQRANPVADRILLSSDNSELYVCMPKIFLAYKRVRRLSGGVKLHSRFTLKNNLWEQEKPGDRK